jgi:Coenzyme PQQ synthesis protein D (PqqD)
MDATFAFRLAPCSPDSMEICSTSTVVARRDLLCCDLPDGAVILDLVSGVYYTLDSVGTFIWTIIQTQSTVDSVVEAVVGRYAVERERSHNDVLNLFSDMKAHKLIEVYNGPAS